MEVVGAVEVRFRWPSLVEVHDDILLVLQGLGSLIVVDVGTEARRGDENIIPLAVPPPPPFPAGQPTGWSASTRCGFLLSLGFWLWACLF